MIFLNAYMMYVWMNSFFCQKIHLWNFGIFLFENTFMNAWFFLECIYNVCPNDFILFMRKYIYEILDFLFLKMHLWMYDFFFWNAYIMYVWMIFYEKMHLWNFGLFLFENAFMNVWFFLECIYNVCVNDFFMRKCIYEILNFFFLKMHLWMHDFFYEKIHLWRRDFFNAYIMHERIFFWKNVFMNAWFVLDLFWFFFWIWMWECMYDVQNSRKIHKRFCECIHRYLQADFVPLKIPA